MRSQTRDLQNEGSAVVTSSDHWTDPCSVMRQRRVGKRRDSPQVDTASKLLTFTVTCVVLHAVLCTRGGVNAWRCAALTSGSPGRLVPCREATGMHGNACMRRGPGH